MFGDTPIFGSFDCSIDSKGRIILPSSVNAEKGDSVVVCASEVADDIFDIYPLSVFVSSIKDCDNTILNGNDEASNRAIKKRRDVCSLVLSQLTISSGARLSLNTAVLEKLGLSPVKLYGLGEYDRIKFFASEKSFEEYTKRPYMKVRGNGCE